MSHLLRDPAGPASNSGIRRLLAPTVSPSSAVGDLRRRWAAAECLHAVPGNAAECAGNDRDGPRERCDAAKATATAGAGRRWRTPGHGGIASRSSDRISRRRSTHRLMRGRRGNRR
uniref:(northern house mosquito) hypothetical protein n=1 Tax=Culex pipiens TaxID=7175 RepID=A0A8D8BTL6_CULPI